MMMIKKIHNTKGGEKTVALVNILLVVSIQAWFFLDNESIILSYIPRISFFSIFLVSNCRV